MALSTAQDLIDKSLTVIGVVDIEGTPTTAQRNLGLDMLNAVIDTLHANRLPNYVYTDETIAVTDYDTTWGSAGDVTTTRPVKILSARKVVSGIETPLKVMNLAEYRADIRDKDLAGEPQMVAYDPTYPLGTLYTYPSGAYTLKVTSLKPWSQYAALSTALGLPPGYVLFLIHYLAVVMASMFERNPPDIAVQMMNKGMADLGAINAVIPVVDNPLAAPSAREGNAAVSAAAAAGYAASINPDLLQPKDAELTTLSGLSAQQASDLVGLSGFIGGLLNDADAAAARGTLGIEVPRGLFYKVDATSVAFTKTGAGTASIKAGTKVDVAGTTVTFTSDTAIAMPTLTAGTDYAIWVKDDGTLQADASFTTAPGAGNWRKIGGFHYAPGGNAAAQAGGDTTPAINAYSFWDLKFRPACPDPRGMTLVSDSFWSDIYLLGVDHLTNGTSKYNVTIADGSSPPKIPTKFGGNGSTAYSTMTWWEANEVLQSWGKRSPTYDEFAALAYGTTEATSGDTDPSNTILRNSYTSRWGVMLATGNLWVWGYEFGGGAAAASWVANTGGRGSTYQMENAVVFGGDWGLTSGSGSRASHWNYSPTSSYSNIGARGVCDHMILE